MGPPNYVGGKERHFQCVDPEIAHEFQASEVLKSLTCFCFCFFFLGWGDMGWVGREAFLEHSNMLSSSLFWSFLGLIVIYFSMVILSHVRVICNCDVLFWSYHIFPLSDHTFWEILEIWKQRDVSRELYNPCFYTSLMWLFKFNLIKIK